MCYHKEQKATAKQLKKQYKADFPREAEYQPRELINGFDHPLGPIITNEKPGEIQLYNWGLVPDPKLNIKRDPNTLNAKFETLHERPSYRNYITQRCLVPATGLWEWRGVGTFKGKELKEKYLITIEGHKIFSFAGLWHSFVHPQTQQQVNTYTLVTFDEMAAVLKDDAAWLEGGELILNNDLIIPPVIDLFS